MTTFKLDSNNNLEFESNFETLSGSEALIQDIRNLLLMFKGENPFDTSEGIDYYTLMQKGDLSAIKSAIVDRIKADSRVKTIQNVTISNNKGNLDLSLQILTSWGELVNV